MGQTFQLLLLFPFFFVCLPSRRAGVLSLPSNYFRSLGWEMRETTMWGRVFQGCYFIVFGSSEMLLHCTRVEKITKSLSAHPLTQALAAKIGQESCQTCSASHPPMRQSSADWVNIRTCCPRHRCEWLRRPVPNSCTARSDHIDCDQVCFVLFLEESGVVSSFFKFYYRFF